MCVINDVKSVNISDETLTTFLTTGAAASSPFLRYLNTSIQTRDQSVSPILPMGGNAKSSRRCKCSQV